jgi:hypothetical protein
VSDWTWEYMPDAEHAVGGLPPELLAEVEVIARRLADQASVRYLGDPPAEESGVSKLLTFVEGRWMIKYQEVRRMRLILISRAVHWPL